MDDLRSCVQCDGSTNKKKKDIIFAFASKIYGMICMWQANREARHVWAGSNANFHILSRTNRARKRSRHFRKHRGKKSNFIFLNDKEAEIAITRKEVYDPDDIKRWSIICPCRYRITSAIKNIVHHCQSKLLVFMGHVVTTNNVDMMNYNPRHS